jgi:hypothetical protein
MALEIGHLEIPMERTGEFVRAPTGLSILATP